MGQVEHKRRDGNNARLLGTPVVFPNQPIPDPVISRLEVEIVEADQGPLLVYGDPIAFSRLPEEAYLREAWQVDLDDPASLAAFMTSYGALTTWGSDPFAFLPPAAAWNHPARKIHARARRVAAAKGESVDFSIDASAAKLHLSVVRALWVTWKAEIEGDDPGRALTESHLLPAATRGTALKFLEAHLNYALRAAHPWLHFPTEGVADDAALRAEGRLLPNAYSGLVLQLANHITEGATYRRCRRADCPTGSGWFVRKRGGARYGQYRTKGVLDYCSPRCGEVQRKRDQRRRVR